MFNKKNAPKSLAEAKQRCSVIVLGTLTSEFQPISKTESAAELNVKTVWLGKVDSSYKVLQDKCAPMKPSETYLFFSRVGNDNILRYCGDVTPVAQAGATLAQLGEGWPTDVMEKSPYPHSDERLKCPDGKFPSRHLSADLTRTYSCQDPKDRTKPEPMISVYDNGKIKEQGTIQNLTRIGEWNFSDRDGKVITKHYEQNGDETCDDSNILPDHHVLIGYVKNKIVYSFMVWDGAMVKRSKDQSVKNIKSLIAIDQKEPILFTAKSPHRDAHSNSCIYSGAVTAPVIDFTLVSTKKFNFILPIPQAAKDQFNALRGPCVRHGDSEPDQCVFSELLAVTDLNKNGRFEFWFKQPYLWDFGMAISEVSADGKSLGHIASDCSDCSD
jgi:hypothetical protein